METVADVDVSVNASLSTVGPYAWLVTFVHDRDGMLTVNAGDQLQLQPFYNNRLRGSGVAVSATTLQDGDAPVGGYFNLTLGNSSVLVPNACPADRLMVLLEQVGVPLGVHVSRDGPDADNGYNWTVTLPSGASLDTAGNLSVNGTAGLTGVAPEVSITTVQQATVALGGSFSLTFSDGTANQTTEPIAANASAADVAAAVMALDGLEGVLVAETAATEYGVSGNSSSGARLWTITFASLVHTRDIFLEANGSALTGTAAIVEVTRSIAASVADVQLLTVSGNATGTFSFSALGTQFNSTSYKMTAASSSNQTALVRSFDIAANASAAEVQEAVSRLTEDVGAVFVERGEDAADGTRRWYLLFAEAFCNSTGLLAVNSAGLADGSGSSINATLALAHACDGAPLAGSFSLSFGKRCNARATGVFCEAAWTEPIPAGAGASTVARALGALPEIVEVAVERKADAALPAPEGYGV
ncbi:unnamed protein product, partial [Phaeothamnion confervicola]